MKKIILSLFDYTGNWSEPFENDYEVIKIDIKNGIDILSWDYKKIKKENVKGILAAIPCTDYAVSGARWFKEKDINGTTEKSQELVKKTKEIIDYFQPEFWVIENPVSRIHTLNTWIGKPKMYFHPYEYAHFSNQNEQYSKKTSLYGNFNYKKLQSLKGNLKCLDNKKIHEPTRKDGTKIKWASEECKEARQETPKGFSKAFFISTLS